MGKPIHTLEKLGLDAVTLRQVSALTRLSFRRLIGSLHGGMLVGILLPMILFSVLFALGQFSSSGNGVDLSILKKFFHGAYMAAVVHFALIIAGAIFAASAVRDELDKNTLHHLYLQPIPRWLIPLGKLAGFFAYALPLMGAVLLFAVFMLLLPSAVRGDWEFLTPGFFLDVSRYLIVAAIGTLLYSSIFLMFSMFFKNVIYVFFVIAWEASVHFMPDALKNFTISYYLMEMLPWSVTDTSSAVAILSEGPGTLQTAIVLPFVAIGTLGIACYTATRKQCLYGGAA